jgi:hypothetical protein
MAAGAPIFETVFRAVPIAPPFALEDLLRRVVEREDDAFAAVERDRLAEPERERLGELAERPFERARVVAGLRLLDVDFCVDFCVVLAMRIPPGTVLSVSRKAPGRERRDQDLDR